MFRSIFIVHYAVVFICALNAQEPADYVNPFIGTSNYGAAFPGAVAPSGMASVVPYNVSLSEGNELNTDVGWLSNPYVFQNKTLTGFSHVNLHGVGCPDLGSILLMPLTGALEVDYQKYGTFYSHEEASPGYYSNYLEKYKVVVELTATTRTGMSRYTFPAGTSHMLIHLGHGLTNESGAMIRRVSDTRFEGFKMLGTLCYNPQAVFPVYFVIEFNKPPLESGYWKKMKELPGVRHQWSPTSGKYKLYTKYQKELAGEDIGAFLTWSTQQDEQIQAKVGISYVSIENAWDNLKSENPDWDFDGIRKETYGQWNRALSRISVEGGTHDDKVIFYTGLYHILFHPNILQDVNGDYPAMESAEILNQSFGNRYTVYSLWDTYRNVHPFLTLVYPERQLELVRSMIDMYRESGWLPKWELFGRETLIMEGDPAIPVIVDTWMRGIRDFDIQLAYKAMKKSATTPGPQNLLRPDIDFYIENGYIPINQPFDNSVSHALEYYVADWNLAQLAKKLGHMDDHKRFIRQSLGYKNYFDPELGLIRPKLEDGSFLIPFDPRQGENFEPSPGFHEGNAYQYTFYVPHDINGLMKLMGGSKAFVDKLQAIFDDGHFDMTNEPDINYPYLFNYVKGEEWRTQKEVSRLIREYFRNTPDGLPGNDDSGTMSTWLLYSMMGFYPVCPGNMNYALTTPVFDRITIHLNPDFYSNTTLTITKTRGSIPNARVRSIKLDGKNIKGYFLDHSDFISGGSLEFILDHE